MVPLGSLAMNSCASTQGWTRADWELARRGTSPQQYAIDMKRTRAQQYVESVLYVGMPEDEFIQLFTETPRPTDSDRPYIIERNGHRYIILELPLKGEKARVTFHEGTLVRFERYGTGSNPWGYADETYMLKGSPVNSR